MANFLLVSERQKMPLSYINITETSPPTTVAHFPPNVTADNPFLPVLITDDDPHITRLYEAILSRLGLQTVSIADGHAALEYSRHNPLSLVISDLNKPFLNGMDMLSQIREYKPTANLPFFMVTTSRERDIQHSFTERGGTLLLYKPFNMHTFTSAVMKHLRENPVHSPP